MKTSFGKSTILTIMLISFCIGIGWSSNQLSIQNFVQFNLRQGIAASFLKMLSCVLLVFLIIGLLDKWVTHSRMIHQWLAAIRGCLLAISFSFGAGALFFTGYTLSWVMPQIAYFNQQSLFQGILDVPLHMQNPYLFHIQTPIQTTLPIYLPADHSDKSLQIRRQFESLSAGKSYFVEIYGVWKIDLSMYPTKLDICNAIAVRSIGRFVPDGLLVHSPSIEERLQIKISQIHLAMAAWPETVLKRVLPPAQASVINGILFGNKGGIDSELIDGFAALDITHLLAASGAHLAALFLPLRFILKRLRISRRMRLVLMVGSVWIYAMIAGFRISTCRAAIVVTLYEMRPQGNASTSFYRFILTAGFFCLLANPYWLFQISFQLSFAVTIGFAVASDPLRRFLASRLGLKRSPVLLHLISGLLIIEAMSIPLIAVYFHQLNWISFISNLFLPLVIEALIPIGLLFTIGCSIDPSLMQAVLAPIFLKGLGPLEGWLKAAAMNPGLIQTVEVSSWQVLLYYIGAAILLILYYSHKQIIIWSKNMSFRLQRTLQTLIRTSGYITLSLLLLTVSITFFQGETHEDQIEVWFVNSGQQLADVIRLPSGEIVLIWLGQLNGMTGSSGISTLNDPLVKFLRGIGVKRINLFIFADAKSSGMEKAAAILFKQFKIGQVYLPLNESPSLTEDYLTAYLNRMGISYQDLNHTQVIQFTNGAVLKNFILQENGFANQNSSGKTLFAMALTCFNESILFSNHLPNEILPTLYREIRSIPAICLQQDIPANDLLEFNKLSPRLVVVPLRKTKNHQVVGQVDSSQINPLFPTESPVENISESSPENPVESTIYRSSVASGQACHLLVKQSQIYWQIEYMARI